MSDKNQILDEVSSVIKPKKDLDARYLLQLLLIISLVFVTAFPKMYLQHEIYYKSREIAKLQREYDSLKEENEIIKSKVEAIKFKNQILDTIF